MSGQLPARLGPSIWTIDRIFSSVHPDGRVHLGRSCLHALQCQPGPFPSAPEAILLSELLSQFFIFIFIRKETHEKNVFYIEKFYFTK